MKKIQLTLLFALLVILADSCAVNIAPDTKIHGIWRDINTRYFFGADNTYYIKYLRVGAVGDSILNDSVFGTYKVEQNRSNLTFEIVGYVRRKDGQVVTNKMNGTTWHYEVKNDTLSYISKTTIGKLYKQK